MVLAVNRVGSRLLHRAVNASDLRRLWADPHPLAARLADTLRAWQAREPLVDPILDRVERQRRMWLATPDDAPAARAFADRDSIAAACRASKPPIWAELLYRLVRDTERRTILELGTNLGISAAYLAAATRRHGGTVLTMDGAPARVELARALHAELGLPVEHVVGKLGQTLPAVLARCHDIDLAFLDADHRRRQTLAYLDAIAPNLAPDALVVFDDIRWSPGMAEAWADLRRDRRFALVVDLVTMGICVVGPGECRDGPALVRVAPASTQARRHGTG